MNSCIITSLYDTLTGINP